MAIRSRNTVRSQSKLLAASDLFLCLEIPLILGASWLLPEKNWTAACQGFARMQSALGLSSKQRSPASLAAATGCLGSRTQAEFDLRHAALSSESYFQIFRSYRPDGWKTPLVLEGEEHLKRALAAGHGVVLWAGYFSFSSLTSKKALAEAGYKVWHLSSPEHGFSRTRFGMRFLNPMCTRIENRYLAGRIVIDRGNPNKASMTAARLLRKNAIVSIRAGSSVGKRVVPVTLLDGVFELAIGAPSLATLCGSPLLPLFAVRDEEKGCIRVIIEEPLTVGQNTDKEKAVEFLAQAFADRLARYIRQCPDQWSSWRNFSLRQ